MKRLIVAGLLCLPMSFAAVAEDKHRQLSAHEHGHGSFNIAIEGKRVNMELEAPGADIVGFEHKARTKKQKAAVSAAKKKLKELTNVVGLPEAAGCKLKKASIELHIEGDDHDDDKHGKKKKAKHSHEHGKKEAKKEAKEESHSEFHAEYQLSCASPEKLVEIQFPYFKNFKSAEELEVSVAGPKSQKKFEVERDTGKINLGGII
ncbi:MAG: ZrgA family zinc uptake protein [Hyphomicrobiaceae bacterium]